MTEVHQKYIRFPEGVAKSGIFVLWWKIFAMKIGPELMAVDKLFRSKHSEDDQAENKKYSRRWHHMDFGKLKRWRWIPTSSILLKVSKILY